MNSVGVLPTAYIDVPESSVSKGLLENALEIYEQYIRKAEMKRETSVFFQSFKPLHSAQALVRSSQSPSSHCLQRFLSERP